MASAPAGGEDATAGCAWSSQPNEEEDASKEGRERRVDALSAGH